MNTKPWDELTVEEKTQRNAEYIRQEQAKKAAELAEYINKIKEDGVEILYSDGIFAVPAIITVSYKRSDVGVGETFSSLQVLGYNKTRQDVLVMVYPDRYSRAKFWEGKWISDYSLVIDSDEWSKERVLSELGYPIDNMFTRGVDFDVTSLIEERNKRVSPMKIKRREINDV